MTDVGFLLSSYKDFERCQACVAQIRTVYPEAPVVVHVDGDDDPRYQTLKDATVYTSPQTYVITAGGAMWRTRLEYMLEMPVNYILKIDPDTKVWRPLNKVWPDEVALVGTFDGCNDRRWIQGGIIGLTQATVRAILDSKFLTTHRRELQRYWETWANFDTWFLQWIDERNQIAEDVLIGYVVDKLGIPIRQFDEVLSQWLHEVSNDDLKYAVTHPFRWPCDRRKCAAPSGR